MPIHEYECRACGARLELIRSAAEVDRDERVRCPKCSATEVERVWSRVAVGTARKGYHPAKPLDV